MNQVTKGVYEKQIISIDNLLECFICCDGVYRTNPEAYNWMKENLDTLMQPIIGREAYEYLNDTDYFVAPASTKYHGAWQSGLIVHSLLVTRKLLDLSSNLNLSWKRLQSPFIVGMLHDACKINNYKKQSDGSYTYDTSWMPYPGHGEKSLVVINRIGLKLTEEESFCIRFHMGAYETKEWEFYDRAIKRYPNVLWTNTADMYAAKVNGV